MYGLMIFASIIGLIWWLLTRERPKKPPRYDRIDNINEVNFLARHYGKPKQLPKIAASAMTTENICPFCTLPAERIVHANAHAIAIRDAYPVSPGHTLVIPKRHIGSFFETTAEEKTALFELLERTKKDSSSQPSPLNGEGANIPSPSQGEGRVRVDGWNIGINDGATAGQTVPHLHIHLIPRYKGDVADPRGGVRWVIAEKAKYW